MRKARGVCRGEENSKRGKRAEEERGGEGGKEEGHLQTKTALLDVLSPCIERPKNALR